MGRAVLLSIIALPALAVATQSAAPVTLAAAHDAASAAGRGNQRVTSQNPETTYESLTKYGRDLTDAARRGNLAGQVFVIFVMTVAAAEAAVGLAIIISIFRHHENVDLRNINLMRG